MNKKYLLILILFLAAALRFFQLGSNPPSLTWDEVAWGYNAYTLGIDGRDEFGRFLPYDYLESFGDFKPPAYAYLDILPIKLFGLTEFAVRFPAALFGVLTVLVTYFLVKEIFKKQRESQNSETIAFLSSGLLAISPWHIMLSRAAFEANVATFFIVTGVWLFLKGIHGKLRYFILAVIPFVASLYTFNTARVVVPLLVLILVIGFWRILWKHKKEVIIATVLGLILVLPTTPFLFSDQAKLRFKEVNIFSDITVIERSNQEIANDNNALWSKVIHHRHLTYSVEFLKHYFDNLSFKFLFITGDGNPKFALQDVGQMYLWEFPFLLAGVLFLIKKREGSWWIIPLWLLIGILPAATARETPHALRIETTLPMFQIFVAYGIVSVYLLLKKYRKIFIGTLSLVAALNLVYYLHGYYVHYPKEFSKEWQYGYKESINYVKQVEREYDQIIVTTQLGRPYAYYVFYLPIEPGSFRKDAIVNRDPFGFVTIKSIGKYTFVDTMPDIQRGNKKTLYIAPGEEILPKGAKVLKEFKTLNHQDSLKAYTIN